MIRVRNVIVFILSFATIATYAFGEVSQKTPYEDAIKMARKEIWQDINSGKAGSATIAIMEDGKVVYAEGFGMADRENSIPVDRNTIFNMGSISKMYVATAIMLLVDEGKISLDRPVADYLPEFRMADPRYKDITVRMLLSHSSGLPGSCMANSFGFKRYEDLQKDTISALARSHLKAAPGATAPYCNDGFTLAEMVVERVSGKKYIDFLDEKIFIPLGLKDTYLSVGELKGKPVAMYYDPQTGKKHPPEALSVLGAGGLSVTAVDLCLFADTFSGNNKIFKPGSLEEMKKPQPPAFAGKVKNPHPTWGLGWDSTETTLYKAKGIQVFGKDGGTGNYTSMLYTIPDRRISVAAIATGPHSSIEKIALDVLNEVLMAKGLTSKEDKAVSMPVKPEKMPQALLSFGGYYVNTGNSAELAQAILDTEKNTATIRKINNVKKAPDADLVYSNGYFHDKDNNLFYFISIDGEDYIACRLPADNTDVIILQKVKTIGKPQSLKIDMDGKGWLRRNVYRFEGIGCAESHFVKSSLYKELPGYVDFGGIKRIESAEFAGMPLSAVRDQTELALFNKDGATWAWLSDMLYSPADKAGALRMGKNDVHIGGYGYNEWLKADEDMILSFTKPEEGRIIVFSSDDTVKYDSVIDTGDIYVEKGSFVEFAGRPGDLFAATGRT